MKKVIHSILNCDQTAYVKGQYVGELVRLIDDLITYADQENLDGIIFAANIEKAFDFCGTQLCFCSLKKFGFGDSFIKRVRTFFNISQSCVMNNDKCTGFFRLKRGTRQAAYLFI